jgi:7-cyano-7-deazaguanine reductase
MTDTSKLSTLGGPTVYRYDNPSPATLEVFDNPHPEHSWVVELDCTEFTSLCPVTGQPDFARLHIHYVPGPRCVESKSLKLYLGAYRNHGAFHEDCINRIAGDLVAVLAPRMLRVFGDFRPRGGIAIRPLALLHAPDAPLPEQEACLRLLAQHDACTRAVNP